MEGARMPSEGPCRGSKCSKSGRHLLLGRKKVMKNTRFLLRSVHRPFLNHLRADELFPHPFAPLLKPLGVTRWAESHRCGRKTSTTSLPHTKDSGCGQTRSAGCRQSGRRCEKRKLRFLTLFGTGSAISCLSRGIVRSPRPFRPRDDMPSLL